MSFGGRVRSLALAGIGTSQNMDSSVRSHLLEILHEHREAIAERWYQAVAQTSYVPLGTSEVRQRLNELVGEAVALLLAEDFDHRGAEGVGETLACLRFLQPEALGGTQEVLIHELLQGLLPEQADELRPRLAALVANLAIGYFRQARQFILEEQEQIRNALLTQLRQAQDSLRASEETARVLLNVPTQVALLIDPEGTIIGLNEAAAVALGKSKDQLIDTCAYDQFTPEVAARRRALAEEVMRSGKPARFEDERVGRWLDNCIYPVFDAQGAVRRLAVFALDITERKQAEQALREHAERLSVLRKIDNAILAAQSLEEIGQAALRYIQQLVPCERASLVVFDLAAGEALLLAVLGDRGDGMGAGTRLSLEGADAGIKALRGGEVRVADDISEPPRSGVAVQAVQAEGMRACIAAPLISHGELLGSLNLWSDRPAVFGPQHVEIVREAAGSLAVAIQQARLFQSVSQKSEQLRVLRAKLADAEEAERRRLVLELHDRVGDDLTALNLSLSLVRAELPEDMPTEKAKQLGTRLDDSLALVGQATDHIRDVMADLRPPMLDDYGLVATLHWFGARFASLTGASITVEGEEPVPRLAARVEINLFRIAQEVLTNVAKHARAEHVLVTLRATDDVVRLVIADDGVGFDPAQLAMPDGDRGWGLMNMTERAEAMGGTFRVESRPRQGTRVIVEVGR